MLSDEEKQAIDVIKNEIKAFETVITAMEKEIDDKDWLRKNILEIKGDILVRKTLLNLIEKQSKEIEELKETLKCTQNSWYEDTQKIEEMKKQIDLDNECEIALNNRIMDLENADKKWEDKIKAKIEEYKKQIEKMEKNDIGRGFTLGKEWSDLKAKVEFGQSLIEKE